MTSPAYEGQYLDVTDKETLDIDQKYVPSRSPSPQRKPGESSPSGSEYDEEFTQASKQAKFVLDAFNTKSTWNIRIKDASGVCLYYVDNSIFTPKKPDVTLHAGSEKTDPVVGVARFSSMYASKVTVGLGDPTTNEKNVIWSEMTKDKRWHMLFSWTLQLPDGSSRTFQWRRAHRSDDPDSDANFVSAKNYKLVDLETDATVAIFGSNRFKSWHKLGKFTFMIDYGRQFQVMVLLTGLALIEMSRRRSRTRRNGGGGGSGGGG